MLLGRVPPPRATLVARPDAAAVQPPTTPPAGVVSVKEKETDLQRERGTEPRPAAASESCLTLRHNRSATPTAVQPPTAPPDRVAPATISPWSRRRLFCPPGHWPSSARPHADEPAVALLSAIASSSRQPIPPAVDVTLRGHAVRPSRPLSAAQPATEKGERRSGQ